MWYRALLLLFVTLALRADTATTADEKSLTDLRNFRGNLQLYNYDINMPGELDDAYATAFGGSLGYKSHLFYRFGVELEYSGSHAVGNTKNPQRLLLFNNDKPSLHLNTLSQGNLYYQNPTTYFRLGAQTFNTPLFNEDPTRIVPWGATGASITYNRLKELTLIAAAISAIRSNTSAVYRKESASGPIDHGLYFLGGSYYLNDANWLQAYYYLAPDLYDSLYLQYEYRRLLFDTALICFGIQYIRTYTNGDSDSHADTSSATGGDDVDLTAVKASMDYAGLDLQLSYSKNRGQSGINNGYGGLSKVYTSSMVANGRKSNRPETWSLKTAYEVLLSPRLGTTELAIWLTRTAYADAPEGDFFSTYAHLRQLFGINTSAYLRWERIDYADRDDATYVRLILKQRF